MQQKGTVTTPVSGPGLPPGSTETVSFVPSGAPTPPGKHHLVTETVRPRNAVVLHIARSISQ